LTRAWLWALSGIVVAAELALGAYMAIGNGFIYGDALSRLANAFYVLYSRDPHLAAIGFVWNPLPSLLALPFLALYPLFPVLVTSGMIMAAISALFAGITFFTVLGAFRHFSVPVSAAAVACGLLFAFHPFQFWYGANGMSEAMFGCFLAIAVTYWTLWLKTDGTQSLIIASLALGLAFLTRYEAVPFAAALAAATWLNMQNRRALNRKWESAIIVLILPIAFAAGSWIWLNYTIMGDPLYFLQSAYSNQGQSEFLADNETFASLRGNPFAGLWFVLQRAGVFLLPYLAILIHRRLATGTLRHMDLLYLTLLVWSIPLFQWVMLMLGSSYGWLRFFYYPLLVAFAWLPYEWSCAPANGAARLGRFVPAALALSCFLAVFIMNRPWLAPEEYTAIHFRESESQAIAEMQQRNAALLDREVFEKSESALVMTDSFNAYRIIISSRHPGRFMNTTDRDFEIALENPYAYQVTHILVPPPGGLNDLNAVLVRYPGIYEEELDWVELEMTLEEGWKLFRVVAPTPGSN